MRRVDSRSSGVTGFTGVRTARCGIVPGIQGVRRCSSDKVQVGVDEAGTGAWFGPFVVCAVAWPESSLRLRDSKKLTRYRRDALRSDILNTALAIGMRVVTVTEMESVGYAVAWRKAVLDTAKHVLNRVGCHPVIVDGSPTRALRQDFAAARIRLIRETGADDRYAACSAASILAKTTRDFLMQCYASRYPEYGLHKHKGYGTAEHRSALHRYGAVRQHRSRGWWVAHNGRHHKIPQEDAIHA